MEFSSFSEQKKSEGVELLRAKQFEMVMNGNVTMAIWLGKQYLGQRDKSEIDHTVNLPSLPTIQIRTKNGSD